MVEFDEYKKRQEKATQDYSARAVDDWKKIEGRKTIVEKMDEEIEIAGTTDLTDEEKEKLELFRTLRRGIATIEKKSIEKEMHDYFEEMIDFLNITTTFNEFKKCSDIELKNNLTVLKSIFKTIMESDTKTNATNKSGPRR